LNAFAWEHDTGIPGTSGLVGFGATLFRNELFGYDETGTTVMSIVAHEFGHVLQASRGYLHNLPVLKCEINADFLAGYYLGKRKLRVTSVSLEIAQGLFARLGRLSDGNPNRTHGDTNERVNAVRAGFHAGFNERASLDAAVEAGWRHVGYSG